MSTFERTAVLTSLYWFLHQVNCGLCSQCLLLFLFKSVTKWFGNEFFVFVTKIASVVLRIRESWTENLFACSTFCKWTKDGPKWWMLFLKSMPQMYVNILHRCYKMLASVEQTSVCSWPDMAQNMLFVSPSQNSYEKCLICRKPIVWAQHQRIKVSICWLWAIICLRSDLEPFHVDVYPMSIFHSKRVEILQICISGTSTV